MSDDVVDLEELWYLIHPLPPQPLKLIKLIKLSNPRRKHSHVFRWAECCGRVHHYETSSRARQERCQVCGAELVYGDASTISNPTKYP